MNVAFTRARSKLIIIGSRKTLRKAPMLSEFFELMDSRGWIRTLPPNAHLMHDFGGVTPKKRSATELGVDVFGFKDDPKDNVKRCKNAAATEEVILKGRPLLRDVVNGLK